MIRNHYDKILLGIALAFLLAVFGYAALRPDPRPITELVDIPALRATNTYEVSELSAPDLSIPRWTEPSPQSAGSEWVFDVFTPPVINYDPRNEIFIVQGAEMAAPVPWPIELVAVRQNDYRVQMLGWLGQAGDYRINLENLETGQLVLAREGRDYPDLGITVRSFKVEKLNVNPDGTPVLQDVATAVIHDKRLDREVTLRSDVRTKDEELAAVFRSRLDNQEFRARAGDSFTLGEFTYRVEELEAPVRATVTRTGGAEGSETETKTLIAREMGDSRSAPANPSPQRNRQGTGDNGRDSFGQERPADAATDSDF